MAKQTLKLSSEEKKRVSLDRMIEVWASKRRVGRPVSPRLGYSNSGSGPVIRRQSER